MHLVKHRPAEIYEGPSFCRFTQFCKPSIFWMLFS